MLVVPKTLPASKRQCPTLFKGSARLGCCRVQDGWKWLLRLLTICFPRHLLEREGIEGEQSASHGLQRDETKRSCDVEAHTTRNGSKVVEATTRRSKGTSSRLPTSQIPLPVQERLQKLVFACKLSSISANLG